MLGKNKIDASEKIKIAEQYFSGTICQTESAETVRYGAAGTLRNESEPAGRKKRNAY